MGRDRKYIDKNPFPKVSQLRVDNKPIRYIDLIYFGQQWPDS